MEALCPPSISWFPTLVSAFVSEDRHSGGLHCNLSPLICHLCPAYTAHLFQFVFCEPATTKVGVEVTWLCVDMLHDATILVCHSGDCLW